MRSRLALVICLTLVVPAGARAAAGSIAGTVTDPHGEPIHTICVDAEDLLLNPILPGSRYQTVVTDEDGTYRIDGLRPGAYLVRFRECAGGGPLGGGEPPTVRSTIDAFAEQWWDGQTRRETATPVLVTGAVDGIDASLAPAPGITGLVLDEQGRSVGGVSVSAVTLDGSGWRSTTTEADGRYKLLMDQNHDSSWKITFHSSVEEPAWGEFAQEWYDDVNSFEDARVVEYTAGITTVGIDATLTRTGTVAGTIRDSRGNPVGVCVSVFSSSGELLTTQSSYDTFRIGGLRSGRYKLLAEDCHLEGHFAPAWHGGSSFEDAAWVDVTWGEVTTGLELVLPDGGTLSGRLTHIAGQPAVGWMVIASDTEGRYSHATLTDDEGRWSIGPLVPGDAVIAFWPDGLAEEPAEYYDDVTDPTLATLVPVRAETVTAGIDAVV